MILVNNYVLAQFLGICPFLGVSKKLDSAVGMGVAVIFVMVLATIATWPIMKLLNSFEIGYLQTVVFILVIAALVQLIEMMMKKYIPSLHKALGVYLPLITTNCAVPVSYTHLDVYKRQTVISFPSTSLFANSALISIKSAMDFRELLTA